MLALSLCIIFVLIGMFLRSAQDAEKVAADVGFEALAFRFNETVQQLHVEWQLAGRPNFLTLTNMRGRVEGIKQAKVAINSKGWPQPQAFNQQGCLQLWLDILLTEPKSINQAISVRYISDNESHLAVCRFAMPNKTGFSYFINTGEVKYSNE
ncbi:hypothetical protein C2869_21490 [Saccharobesus litoralis]|uniref:Uncharacterized protein n=2 Tax=Saccharobesus litoralis TaxID=2172099 RepID=A0A2S0VX78_9ALTE|nr:hypothetical protein C2869_21490 [Saccharobesus litoralis]